jgi:hypothetical protein
VPVAACRAATPYAECIACSTTPSVPRVNRGLGNPLLAAHCRLVGAGEANRQAGALGHLPHQGGLAHLPCAGDDLDEASRLGQPYIHGLPAERA